MYRAIHFFTDLQDNSYPYNVGDIFPRVGKEVSERRYAELSSKYNLRGKPMIEYVEDIASEAVKPSEEEKHTMSKTKINRMSTANLRIFATEQGIDNAEEFTGEELKKLLIDKLQL